MELLTPKNVFAVAVVSRLVLLAVSHYMDYHTHIKFTDIDYRVLTDGAKHVLEGGSRTYRDRDDLVADPWSDPDTPRRRRSRGGPADTDPLPSGKDLDRAAEARAKEEEAAADAGEDVWVEGPPTVDGPEEHFEPPPPPPYPRPSRHAVFAALLLALGILFLAAPGWLGIDDRTGLTLGVASILGGGVLLVLRLRDTRADDGPDDGAIV